MNRKLLALRAKVNKLIDSSEYKSVKLYGISCSRSDLEMVIFFADILLRQGNINGYCIYNNDIKKIFAEAGITIES